MESTLNALQFGSVESQATDFSPGEPNIRAWRLHSEWLHIEGLHSRALQFGGLEFRATDFGPGELTTGDWGHTLKACTWQVYTLGGGYSLGVYCLKLLISDKRAKHLWSISIIEDPLQRKRCAQNYKGLINVRVVEGMPPGVVRVRFRCFCSGQRFLEKKTEISKLQLPVHGNEQRGAGST